MTSWLSTALKGAAMGAANVIPGVSGGTVAFITGIYERLIEAVKSCDGKAIKLILKRDWKGFIERTDFWFLMWLGVGVVFSFVTLARLFEYLFEHHAVHVWAFFFGLILASIYFVGVKVKRWGFGPVLAGIAGTAIAVAVATLFEPAQENDSFFYLFMCGVVAMASMIIPGLSGSFVLLLMGNYELVAIKTVNKLTSGDMSALQTILPVAIGSVVGLVALSHLLSWIFRRFHDVAVALLTGFVAGSLLIIWPWKTPRMAPFPDGGDAVKEKVIGYDWELPAVSGQTFLAIGFIVFGVVLVWLMEKYGTAETNLPDDSVE